MCVEGDPQVWGLGSQRALMWHRIHYPSCSAHHNMSSPLITSPTHEHSFNYEKNINSYQRGPLTTSADNFASLIIHLDFIWSIISGIKRLVFVSNVSPCETPVSLSHSRRLSVPFILRGKTCLQMTSVKEDYGYIKPLHLRRGVCPGHVK